MYYPSRKAEIHVERCCRIGPPAWSGGFEVKRLFIFFNMHLNADKEICCLCSLLSKVNLQTIRSRCLHFCLDYMSVIRWLKRKQITWSLTGRSPFRLVYIRRSFPPPVSNFWRTAHRSLLDSKQPTHTTMPTRRPRRHTDQSKEKLIKYTNNAIA
jgi:hypothetical protein